MAKTSQKSIWGLRLFGLPFLAIGLFMLGWLLLDAWHWWESSTWQKTPARVFDLQLKTSHSGKNGPTYKVVGSYAYDFRGEAYTSETISLYPRGDSVGNYQHKLHNQLQNELRQTRHVTAYVNPQMPTQALLDRTWRWEMVWLKMAFILAFGGFGAGGWIWPWAKAWYIRSKIRSTAPSHSPWEQRKDWAPEGIHQANLNTSFYFVAIFGFFWCAISFPIGGIAFFDQTQLGWELLLIAIFPLVGLGFCIYIITKLFYFFAYRSTKVILHPYPGVLGGPVKGRVIFPKSIQQMDACRLSLECLHTYWENVGSKKSLREIVLWSEQGGAQNISMGAEGPEVSFHFSTPFHLPVSAVSVSTPRHEWRLKVHVARPGLDLIKQFSLPVFITEASQKNLESPAAKSDSVQGPENIAEAQELLLKAGYVVNSTAESRLIRKPLRLSLVNFLSLFISSIFWNGFVIGFYFFSDNWGVYIFLIPFALIGIFLLMATMSEMFSSFTWEQRNEKIVVKPHLFFKPFCLDYEFIDSIHYISRCSTGKTKYYTLYANVSGKKRQLANGVKGEQLALALKKLLEDWKP